MSPVTRHLSPFLIFSLLIANNAYSQNIPACDTLIINCCQVNGGGPNTLLLTAANSSSVLFDYPGFALLDQNGDTIAIETTNYFGIGTFPQPHVMNIVAPLVLPFTGTLQLYMLFFDTLACEFPITIPDTVTGITHVPQTHYNIFPNPVIESFTVDVNYPGMIRMEFTDICGRLIESVEFDGKEPHHHATTFFTPGVIFYKLFLPYGSVSGKLMVLK